MLQISYKKHVFNFKRPAGTSRGVLNHRTSYHLMVWDSEQPEVKGIGECSTIKGLSPDPWESYEKILSEIQKHPEPTETWIEEGLKDFPSIRFGLEAALADLKSGGQRILFPSKFTSGQEGIPINGLIWMGNKDFMQQQIREKIDAGFRCIKLKIGAIDFDTELALLHSIREQFSEKELELRVDANGAFSPEDAMEKLKRLAELAIHSIEQPIKQRHWDEMAKLCESTPVPIALDEDLIGLKKRSEIRAMLHHIQPQHIILKPSLLGGFKLSEIFIEEAEFNKTGWWVTSALEGNIGLNAIAQWTALLKNPTPQGLGTGQLFTNNIPSPLFISNAKLNFDPAGKWDLSEIYG
ncbi:MAG: o-succinylbenzoate synthase [Bacteroidales bacterium]|nr:o-succinylbenzoate synthase [Bacteroidales bacterium]